MHPRFLKFLPVTLLLLSCVLGTFGFKKVAPNQSWPSAAYQSVQLVPLNSGTLAEGKEVPLTLEFARWMAPLATLGSLIQIGWFLFRGYYSNVWGRHILRRHVIICGAGDKGTTLAEDLVKHGTKVCILEIDCTRLTLERLHAQGVICIEGDAISAGALESAGIRRANMLIVTTGNDNDNLAIALTAAKMAKDHKTGRDGPLRILVHVGDTALRDLLQRRQALEYGGRDSSDIRPFNYFQNMARLTLRENPLEVLNDGRRLASEVHLVLPELGLMGIALAVHAARIGHYRSGGMVKIHVVAPDAMQAVGYLRQRYPNIEKCCHLCPIGTDGSSAFSDAVAQIASRLPADAALSVFLSFSEEQDAFSQALLISEKMEARDGLRIILSCAADSAVRCIIEHNVSLEPIVRFMPGMNRVCGSEAVIGEKLDKLARTMHEDWYQLETEKINEKRKEGKEAKVKETYKLWEQLTEEQKDSNRLLADHIPVKIRAAGMTETEAMDAARWSALPREEIEELSRMEHARWCAEKWLAGWNYGERNDKQKTHPNLVPYDQLDDGTQEYDRNTVKLIHKNIILVGDEKARKEQASG